MSETTTIRISKAIYAELKCLAKEQNQNMQVIIEQALKQYKKKKFFDDLNTAFAKLKADKDAWEDETIERKIWDNTLTDGLEKE
jgi:predicted transcriptional regulator